MNSRAKYAPAVFFFLLSFLATPWPGAAGTDDFDQARKSMVERQLRDRDIADDRVLEVMGRVPRHLFVPERFRPLAYADRPLPIAAGPTISQPYIVAFMTQVLELEEGARVLELGAGSGYQAAVLAEMVAEVYTIEIIEELALGARETLKGLGYENVFVKHADGYFGWEEYAPFDAIMITAAVNHIPPPLIRQLKPGGRLILPLGNPLFHQVLTLVSSDEEGKLSTREMMGVRFVPLTGEARER